MYCQYFYITFVTIVFICLVHVLNLQFNKSVRLFVFKHATVWSSNVNAALRIQKQYFFIAETSKISDFYSSRRNPLLMNKTWHLYNKCETQITLDTDQLAYVFTYLILQVSHGLSHEHVLKICHTLMRARTWKHVN